MNRRNRLRLHVLSILALVTPMSTHLSAQEPLSPAGVALPGVVLDRSTGAPVRGALVTSPDQGRRAIADSLGMFTLQGLQPGPTRLLVQRFGYQDVDVSVMVTAAPEALSVRMEPDPVQLQALVVTGSARVNVNGRVLDAASGDPVPWATFWLTTDAATEAGEGSADEGGLFSIEEVAAGAYLLLVEKLGYRSQYVPLGAAAPSESIEVRLEPDSLVMSGLRAMTRELGTRRNSAPYLVRVFDEERLRATRFPDVRHFLQSQPSLTWTPCQGSERKDCVIHRQRAVAPTVYIDELLRHLEDLESLGPGQIFQLETFACSQRVEIRAYTLDYMEQAARRPRIVLPAC
jgi:hypothetical protein